MEIDGRRMCELLVGLGEVDLVGVEELAGELLGVTIRSGGARPVCEGCGGSVWSKGDQLVRLVDLPAFGRPVRLRWRKRRWTCPNQDCGVRSFSERDLSVAPERALLTSRAGRWVTYQVGRRGRTVSEVAEELGCDWHTVNREVGDALLEADVDRFGRVEAVGVDETLFWHKGRWKTKQWCTSVVDVGGRQLSGHVRSLPGGLRPGVAPCLSGGRPVSCGPVGQSLCGSGAPTGTERDAGTPRTKTRPAVSDTAVVGHGVGTSRRPR